ncbi:MAG: hypothetical protein ACM31O_14055 [Bacteroidota bacterium]
MVFQFGTPVVVTARFFDQNGVAVDPTAVRLRLKHRTNAQILPRVFRYGTDVEIVKKAVGVYEFQIVPSASGNWLFRWESDGPDSADEGGFNVRSTPFADAEQV